MREKGKPAHENEMHLVGNGKISSIGKSLRFFCSLSHEIIKSVCISWRYGKKYEQTQTKHSNKTEEKNKNQ